MLRVLLGLRMMFFITDSATASQRWAQGLSNASAKIQAGVEAYTGQSPGQRAAAQRAKWLAKLQASADKWATRVAAVSTADWQQAMITKGLPRIATGAQAAQPKMQAFFAQFLPYLQQGVTTVRAMPKVTLQDGIARAVAMINHNAGFSYRKGQ